jgi:hypothetical protein
VGLAVLPEAAEILPAPVQLVFVIFITGGIHGGSDAITWPPGK